MESGRNHWPLGMGIMSNTRTHLTPDDRTYDIKAVRQENGEVLLWEGKSVRETERICSDLTRHNFNVTVMRLYSFGEGFYGDVDGLY